MSRKPLAKAKFQAPLEGTPKTIRPPSQRTLYLVIVLVTVVFLVVGYLFYYLREQQMRQRVEGGLSIAAQLKADQVAQWRSERLVDANLLVGSPFFIEGVEKFMASPADTETKDKVLTRLAAMEKAYPYHDILLTDVNGSVLLSLTDSVHRLSDMALSQLAVALEEHKAVMTDFHYPPDSNSPQMDVIAPLFPWGADSQPAIGAVVLCIDPAQYLYPLLQSQPVPSETGETLLVERDGDQVLFLNDLRFQKDTALKLRIPLSQQETPAVMAVLGKEGVVAGKDYRGVGVLAALRPVPDSPWYLVAKMDVSEALSAWRLQAGIIIAFVAVLLAAAFTAIGLIWQRRQRLAYQSLYQTEMEAQALRSRFEYLVKYANDIVLLVDDDHHIVEANDRALESYGYRRKEMVGLPLAALIPPGGFSSYRERLRKLQEEGAIVAEAIQQRKDGSTFPVEVSARIIEIEGKPYFQEIIRDITERKRADEELEASKARYKELADSITDVFFAMDRDLRYTYWNKASEELMGIAAEDALGKHLYDVFPDTEETKAAEKEYLKVLGTGKPRSFVHEYTLNGKKRWFDINAYPTETGVSVFVRDITERNKADEVLAEEVTRRRILMEQSRDGISILDEDSKLLEANQRFLEMLGYTPEEVREFHTWDWDTQWTGEELLEMGHNVDEAGVHLETRHRRKDGTVFDVELSVNSVVVGGKKLLFCVSRDITERKLAEEALRQSENKYRMLVDSISDAIIVAQDDSVKFFNDKALEISGYSREEIDSISFWSFIHPIDVQKAAERYIEGLSDGAATQFYDLRFIHKTGDLGWVDVAVAPITWEGKPAVMAVVSDVTERKRAEEALRRSEQNFRDSIENSPLGIRILDNDGKTLYANRALLDMWGYNSVEELEAVPREQRYTPESYAMHMEELEKRRREEFVPLNRAISIVRSDGEVRTLLASRGELLWNGEKRLQVVYQDITERKRAEEMLSASKERYRLLADNVKDAIWLMDLDLNFLWFSPSCERLRGYTVEEMKVLPLDKHVTPESFQRAWDMFVKAMEDEKQGNLDPKRFYGGEFEFCRKDGSTFWAEAKMSFVRNEKGEATAMLFEGRDITERKRAEEALRQSEEKYRTVLEEIEEGYYEINLDGNWTFFNDTFCNSLGYSREELTGMNYRAVTFEGDADALFKIYGEVYRTGEVAKDLSFRAVRKDGSVRLIEASAFPMRNEGGKIIGFRGLGRDVSERKKAEEALRLSEQNFRDSMEKSPLGIRILAKEGAKTVFANRAFLDMWGYTSIEELEAVSGEQRYTLESYAEQVERLEKRRRGKPAPLDYEISIVRSDGQVRYLSVSRGELFWGGEKVFQLVYQDITELKQAAHELEKAVEELQRSNAELERFAYVASHDLQEPLRMVSSYTQLLERRYKDKLDADANDFINYAVGGAERMQELLSDLLVYSRVGTRGKPFKRTDMEAVLEAALDNLQVAIEESKARVTHDPLPTVMADEGQMVQLFQNLIGNSVKFRGKEPPRIHVSAEPRDSEWVFSVKDNGIGIESQYFDRIFLIFQRLHRDEYPGTGTGLAIAKKIVERHGGRIWVESQPGEGSTFYFSVEATGGRQKAKGERQKAKGKRQKAKDVRQHAKGVKR